MPSFIRLGAYSKTLNTSSINRFLHPLPSELLFRLDKGQLGGSEVGGTDVGGELAVGLLLAVRSDQGVDLDNVDLVELLEGLLDLGLVRLDIDNENEGVVLLELLHGRLGVQGVHNDLVLVEAGLMGDRLAVVLGWPGQSEGPR